MDVSEPKLISPLLDGFVMGSPISSHDGVVCCPAMKADSDDKYIVKIISIPASQVKLDALLLAGAFHDRDSALAYFRELADGVVEEAVLLQRLSRLEGFLPYENWQVVPMENGETGYDIYLVGTYRPTLERHLRRKPMTHLGAVNLGLDLCAALAVCRRSGYLYVDLKPGNIFICDDHEYRIGDLGFIDLSSLAYASLPEKYLSAYTAPEITDAYSALNETLDIYAAGLVLYQVYNNGILPFEGRAPAEELPPPEYADYEMAEIIAKACAVNPEDRWQSPVEMGQALVAYMQRNSIDDTPIVPPAIPVEPDPEPVEVLAEEDDEPSVDTLIAEVDQVLDAPVSPVEESDEAEICEETAEISEPEEPTSIQEESSEEEIADENPEQEAEIVEETQETEVAEEAEEAEAEVAFAAEAAALQEELGVSEEVSQILAQADDLIAHEAPEPVVAPEPVEITIPAPVSQEAVSPAEENAPVAPSETEADDTKSPDAPAPEAEPASVAEEDDDEDYEYPYSRAPRKKHRGWLIALVLVILLAGIATAGYMYYENYYLQPILGISLEGQEDHLTVYLSSQIEDELLTVFCTDTYGNTMKASVRNGKATFQDLKPNTRYKVYVEISGFHKLIGVTNDVHVTPAQTTIVDFNAVTGSEDGSVILNFTVQGPETNDWTVTYSAEGEEEKSVSFSGRMVVVNGLTVGKEYTFHLEPATELYIIGEDTITHTASAVILAENLVIEGFHNNAMTVTWNAPEGAAVESWYVRCYNDAGYDKTITVTETKAIFEELDIATAYTVEVTAVGMTQSSRTYVSANSVTIQSVDFVDSNPNQLTVSWTYEGTAPAGGWLLLYTIDGSSEQQVIQCTGESGVISPLIPGSQYSITIQPASGSTVFDGSAEYTAPAAEAFSGYMLSAADMDFRMCKTPENPEWGEADVPAEDYTTVFPSGSKASFAVRLNHEYITSSDQIVTLFVTRSADGAVVSTATQSRTWTSMWYRGFGRIDIPALPQTAGDYTLEIYFNGALVTTQGFTIE
ncbi:MAG: hypothetical protein E7433_04505 [Ruminococcaceae bacterium]|nr:hypothetical protein [Oscillospiraceae bacterium]